MYDYSVKLRDRKLKFRKWKVKDKTKWKNSLKNNAHPKVLEEALVFDCLEDPSVMLTPEEYKYVLIQIRKQSIGETLHYDFTCNNCAADYNFDINFDDVFKPSYESYGLIKAGDVEISMGEIANPGLYKEEVSKFKDDEERSLFDFLMHVKKINGDDSFDFEKLFNYINELDLDISEVIFEKWEKMKFSLNETKNVQCPHCNNVEEIKFDFMPNFLPSNWN